MLSGCFAAEERRVLRKIDMRGTLCENIAAFFHIMWVFSWTIVALVTKLLKAKNVKASVWPSRALSS